MRPPNSLFAWYKRAAAMRDGDAGVEVAKRHLAGDGVAKHRGRAVAALKRAISTQYITPDAKEEAEQLLTQLGSKA